MMRSGSSLGRKVIDVGNAECALAQPQSGVHGSMAVAALREDRTIAQPCREFKLQAKQILVEGAID